MLKLSYATRSGAGAHEQQRYNDGLRAWRKRALPRARWLLFPTFAIGTVYAVVGPASRMQWVAGLLAGGAFSVYLWVRNEPPEHVRRHGVGAEGERATARVLGPFRREGWHLAHNIDTGRGNRDHVVVGPGGVFLLDSKRLGGTVTLDGERVRVERADDPRDSYELPRLAGAMRGEARRLHDEIEAATGLWVWVTPVVVFWSQFDAQLAETNRVVWLDGSRLADWLRAQPARISPEAVATIARQLP